MPTSLVVAWLSTATVANATSSGYRTIWSVDGLYCEWRLHILSFKSGPAPAWFADLDALSEVWQTFYDQDLLAGVDPAKAYLMLGGETEMWGETADGEKRALQEAQRPQFH